jgi:microcystin-dependent protein
MSSPYIGEIRMFAGNFAPRGWALCDGQLLAISQYDALFSLFGTIYGGDGRTTFGLPDLRGRIPLHMGQGPGLSSRPIGQKSGAETVTVTANQLPAHGHTFNASANSAHDQSPAGNETATSTGTALYGPAGAPGATLRANAIAHTGGNQSHDNVMPFLCVNFIVALSGVYPSRN